MKNMIFGSGLVILTAFSFCFGQDKKADADLLQYKLLATTRTSTMQKEINYHAAS
jgi:hypothetical protein